MARKTMTKEVTKTTVKLAVMEIVEGVPTAVTLPDETLIGNVSPEKAQKELNKKHGQSVTVFSVVPETTVYTMDVEKFIEYADVKQPEEDQQAS